MSLILSNLDCWHCRIVTQFVKGWLWLIKDGRITNEVCRFTSFIHPRWDPEYEWHLSTAEILTLPARSRLSLNHKSKEENSVVQNLLKKNVAFFIFDIRAENPSTNLGDRLSQLSPINFAIFSTSVAILHLESIKRTDNRYFVVQELHFFIIQNHIKKTTVLKLPSFYYFIIFSKVLIAFKRRNDIVNIMRTYIAEGTGTYLMY